MNNLSILLTAGFITVGLRALPFVVFARRPMPLWLIRLSKRIPVMILGLLVVYALKDTSVVTAPYGIPEAIALSFLVVIQWKGKNPLLSIFLSTALYVVLLRVLSSVF
jgi:branched-subunit amino acid transport protein AzlD